MIYNENTIQFMTVALYYFKIIAAADAHYRQLHPYNTNITSSLTIFSLSL